MRQPLEPKRLCGDRDLTPLEVNRDQRSTTRMDFDRTMQGRVRETKAIWMIRAGHDLLEFGPRVLPLEFWVRPQNVIHPPQKQMVAFGQWGVLFEDQKINELIVDSQLHGLTPR
jgi:hypothetical protein